jgi:acetolactate synthase I/III small subunit
MSPLNIKKGSSSHSAYDLRDPNAEVIGSKGAVLV